MSLSRTRGAENSAQLMITVPPKFQTPMIIGDLSYCAR